MPSNADTPYLVQVALGTHGYLVDLTQYERNVIGPLRSASDQSPEPGEQSFATEGLWRRSMKKWHHGAGQEYFDEEDSDRARFWKSQRIDVWTKGEIKTLPFLVSWSVTAYGANNGLTTASVVGYGGGIYAGRGDKLIRWTTTTGETLMTGYTGNVVAMASDGATVYVATSTGIHVVTPGATVAAAMGGAAGTLTNISTIAYVNGRLVVAAANVFHEVAPAGTLTTVYTHPLSTFRWRSITAGPTAIYACGDNGVILDSAVIHVFNLVTATTALSAPSVAAQLPTGEIGQVLLANTSGVVVIGTNLGFRLALPGSEGRLTYGPLVKITGGVRSLAARGQYVYFTWPRSSAADSQVGALDIEQGWPSLGRMDLATFTSTLVPAYASDMDSQGAGVGTGTAGQDFEAIAIVPMAKTPIVALADSQLCTTISINGADEDAHVSRDGRIYSGWIRYGTIESKVLVNVDLRSAVLPAFVTTGPSVIIDLIKEDLSVVSVGTYSTANDNSTSTGLAAALTANFTVGEQFQVRLTLDRGDLATSKLKLRRATARAVATPPPQYEIVAPLIVKSKVINNDGDGAEIPYDTLAEYQYLQTLLAEGTVVDYVEGTQTYKVRVTNLVVRPMSWNDQRSFFEGTVIARLVTV